jgi:hypothetical protein
VAKALVSLALNGALFRRGFTQNDKQKSCLESISLLMDGKPSDSRAASLPIS